MAPPVPQHQAATFYKPPWTEEIDRFFINELVSELMNGHYRVGTNNYSAIHMVMCKINTQFGTMFDVPFCTERLFLLRERYNVFRWITKLSGVSHEPITNYIDCSDDAWEFICEKEPLARSYMFHGEKAYDSLKLLFQEGRYSPEFVVNVDEPEVIDLSSDPEDGTDALTNKAKEKEKEVIDAVDGGRDKGRIVIGKEGTPDNAWWDEVAMGSPNHVSDEEVSQPSEFSSTEHCRKRENIVVAGKVGRRLWPEEGSSSASFSPAKKN